MILPGVCGFPAAQARLFRELPLLEVQETFYRPVAVSRAEGWRERAPEGFVFAVKASQFITHDASSPTYRCSGLDTTAIRRDRYGSFRDTEEVWGGWRATEAVAKTLRARAIVFQTPPDFGPSPENTRSLYAFFETLRGGAWALAWEPRGPWPGYVLEKVCSDLGLVHAVDPFASESVTVGFAYFRLHGSPPGERRYRYTYTNGDLKRLLDVSREYDDAWVLFNNLTMFDDAVRFRGLLGVPE